jgi:hypothetical protein
MLVKLASLKLMGPEMPLGAADELSLTKIPPHYATGAYLTNWDPVESVLNIAVRIKYSWLYKNSLL